MPQDATFEDGAEKPLRLKAEDAEDLRAVSAMLQDAILPISEMMWQPQKRRFGLLANRFRWEDAERATRSGRGYERVQSMLVIDSVLRVQRAGFDSADKDQVISVLTFEFEPAADGSGRLVLTLAGDGAIALDVECIDLTLTDVTRPYLAPSGKAPQHPEG